MSLLALRDLTVRLGGRAVVSGVSFELQAGEFVGLIGPNGAGKSTLMRAALGLTPADGEIRLGGDVLGPLPPAVRAARAAWLPQAREIAWALPVADLVALGRTPHRTRPEVDRAAVARAMARMDVARFADRPAIELSGGEQARVLIARALAQEAPLMLADEPMAGLDPAHQLDLMATFAGLAREGSGVLASTHDLGLAARWCDRLILMAEGRVVADGPPAAVVTPEHLARVYGIEAYLGTAQGGMIVQPIARVP